MQAQSTKQLHQEQFNLSENRLYETLFALGNGYIGMRGTFEESLPHDTTEGTYLNGFYDTHPLSYGEKYVGYPDRGKRCSTCQMPKGCT